MAERLEGGPSKEVVRLNDKRTQAALGQSNNTPGLLSDILPEQLSPVLSSQPSFLIFATALLVLRTSADNSS
jgi:hypothetical protein